MIENIVSNTDIVKTLKNQGGREEEKRTEKVEKYICHKCKLEFISRCVFKKLIREVHMKNMKDSYKVKVQDFSDSGSKISTINVR